jgi:alpha-tubulin suppressor-like RCC1 family protein
MAATARTLSAFGLMCVLATGCGTPRATGPEPAVRLEFLDQPPVAPAGDPLGSLRIAVLDADGNTVVETGRVITLSVAPGSGAGSLTGTTQVTALAGIATFTGVAVNASGAHYRLRATSAALTPAETQPFVAALRLVRLRAGDADVCALEPAGKLYCWGEHGASLAGTGNGQSSLPSRRDGSPAFVEFKVSAGNVCANDGVQTYCWGTGFEIAAPTLLTGNHLFSRFGVSGHGCGAEGGGLLWCWGRNESGQLGRGNTGAPDATPGLVLGTINGYDVAVGAAHSCALGGPGAAYCWGDNTEGPLGNGTTVASSVPVPVESNLRFFFLRAGGEFTCGLATTHLTYCWGRNDELQLGNVQAGIRSTIPVPVSGGLEFADLFLGVAHACGTLATGEAYCWGRNAHGELGTGTSGPPSGVPLKVTPIGTELFDELAAGAVHTCARTTRSVVYCWGLNTNGQLGNGSAVASPTPVVVLPPD